MPEETYWVYSAMETCLLSSHVRQIGTSVEGLHSALDDTLSLLVRIKRDLDNYLDHNPCQVCSALCRLGGAFAKVRGDGRGPEDSSVPAPPYQPSPLHSGISGSLGEGAERDHVATPASLPPLIPNSSSSFSSQSANGDKVSISGSSVLRVFTEFGDWLFQRSRIHQSGGSPREEDSFPMENSLPLWIQSASSLPIDSSIHNGFSSLHSHESRISSGFLNSPLLSPPLESLLLQSPSPTSRLDLSLEDIQLPPHQSPSVKRVRKKSAPRKKNAWQRLHLCLKKVFKDYLKEFRAEEVEEEVMGQLGCSLKGRCNSGPCKACQAGGWCSNLHHCYQDMVEAGGSTGF